MSALSPIRHGALGVALVDASYPSEVLTVSLQQENEELRKWIRKSTLEIDRVLNQNKELQDKLEQAEKEYQILKTKKDRAVKERDDGQKEIAGLKQAARVTEENMDSAYRQIERMNGSVTSMKRELLTLGVTSSRIVEHRSDGLGGTVGTLQPSLLSLHNNLSDVVGSVRQALKLNPEILTRVRSPVRTRPVTEPQPPPQPISPPVAVSSPVEVIGRISPQRPHPRDPLFDWENSAVITPTTASHPNRTISPPREKLLSSGSVVPPTDRTYGFI
eukprot:TRINITY_DN19034_c0_g1_i1.p1 TRINITY_DN19034_c0_g1~~TRINITY_DN19034_c0_g1_i1.p1  ORF type:complete len:274 (+),score=40.64 TRINITY_DN19034_c0_g1_i1:54-875(+)